MGKTNIAWTTDVWNPVTGCSRVSTGCLNCYAEKLTATRLRHQPKYQGLTDAEGHWTGEVRCHPELLDQPLGWKKPRRIFVASMSDLFHDRVPWEFIGQVFETMANCPQHIFQVLTKRPGRMAYFAANAPLYRMAGEWGACARVGAWPANVWAGTSVENQKYAPRIDCLLRVPAKIHFVSAEPLLGPLDLTPYFFKCAHEGRGECNCQGLAINQVIVGGESGPGHRPMEIAWLEALADQCDHVGAALFVKQASGQRPGQQGRIPDWLWARKELP